MTLTPLAHLYTFAKFLARPGTVFYTVAWLMVLLVLGTVSQRYVGLYLAQNTFFYGWLFWIGPVPLPSGLPTMAILTLGLIAKLCVATKWRVDQTGIIITHIGALFLMLGGFFTFVGAVDGNMTLFPGERAGYFAAYHDREMNISDGDRDIASYKWSRLKPGQTFTVPGTPITLEVIKICRNCAFTDRDENDPGMKSFRGRARNFDIIAVPSEKEDEVNRSAMLFRISGTGTEKDGIHLSADFIDIAPWVNYGGQTYTFALRKKHRALPFDIELLSFEKSVHPGTDTARAYKSTVMIHEPDGTTWNSIIQMNEPLHYRGYTFYQSSFIDDGARQGTVLAVVKNVGRIFPYLASLIMAVGILLHLFLRARKTKAIAMLAGVLLMMAHPASAAPQQPPLNYDTFNKIPIQDQGRIKPMGTFATNWLEIFSGRDHVDDIAASAWLADILFTPETANTRPIFRINNPAVLDMLGMPHRKGGRYSYDEIMPNLLRTSDAWQGIMKIDPAQLSIPQKQFTELVSNIDDYIELTRSLSVVLPTFRVTDGDLAQKLDVPVDTDLTYIDLVEKRDVLTDMITALEEKAKKAKPDKPMTPTEANLVDIVGRMQAFATTPASATFRVVVPFNDETDTWITPWTAVIKNAAPEHTQIAAMWHDLSTAYAAHDQAAFNRASMAITHDSNTRGSAQIIGNRLAVEDIYNKLAPFHISLWFYIAALGAGIAALTFSGGRVNYARTASLALITLGLIAHAAGLILRMIIVGRPPVTNLYDSIIFVGWVAVALGAFIDLQVKNGFYLFAAAIIGVALGLIGLKFDAEGDTLRVLMAVLDTNFWLSTHVVMITFGYGAALLTGIMAQTFLVVRAARGVDHAALPGLKSGILTLSIVSLLFTAIGTILGGIWADQSWGRFWGWDPKENGALLIVLWLIWSLHGRYSGHLTHLTFMTATAFLPVVVACAWFGVNLLGVGLHSYGFTQSALIGFTIFCAAETVFIIAITSFVHLRQKS